LQDASVPEWERVAGCASTRLLPPHRPPHEGGFATLTPGSGVHCLVNSNWFAMTESTAPKGTMEPRRPRRAGHPDGLGGVEGTLITRPPPHPPDLTLPAPVTGLATSEGVGEGDFWAESTPVLGPSRLERRGALQLVWDRGCPPPLWWCGAQCGCGVGQSD
jgi:hypothetical protein